jgi:hypothetical protein
VSVFVWIDGAATPQSVLSALENVPPDASVDQQALAADRFLAGLGGLGVASRGASPNRDFIDAAAGRLPGVWVGILRFVRRLRDLLLEQFYAGEWRVACERRTALEFLADWFAHGSLADRLGELELDRVDELLRERGQTEGLLPEDQIPEGIPRSHWWWWWPEY